MVQKFYFAEQVLKHGLSVWPGVLSAPNRATNNNAIGVEQANPWNNVKSFLDALK